jgi:DNA-binding NarL/FixJ family response regulator
VRGKMSDVNRVLMRHIRVGVVCANGPVARALAQLLETQLDMEVVGVATTCEDGVRLVEQTSPEVVVVDYELPDGDAATMTAVIRGRVPHVATLVLGSDERPEAVVAVAAAGASGWLPKSEGHRRVVLGIRRVARGEQLIGARQLAGFHNTLRETVPQSFRSEPLGLTRRQREVLTMMLEGLDEVAVAERLHISQVNVRRHALTALPKLGAHSLIECLAKALQRGLIAPAIDLSEIPRGQAG